MDIKQQYERYNGAYRSIIIPEDHPLLLSSGEEVLKKIEDGDTFYVYVGDEMCAWCRSVLEMAIKTATECGVQQIYHIDAWDDERNELFRNRYLIRDNELIEIKGVDAYYRLIDLWQDHISDYVLDVDGEKVDMFQKRIFLPSFFYIEKGKTLRYTRGISALQKRKNDELSAEILADERKLFMRFFTGVEI